MIRPTNVLSELRPGKAQQAREVRAWAAGIPDGRIFVSAVTILEQEMGVLQLERRTPPQGSALRTWFDSVRKAFEGRVLPFTGEVAMRCAAMQCPGPTGLPRFDDRGHDVGAWVHACDTKRAGLRRHWHQAGQPMGPRGVMSDHFPNAA